MTTGPSLRGRAASGQEFDGHRTDVMRSVLEGHVNLAHSAILLDVDGTLLDIAPTPSSIRVPASLISSLAELRNRMGGAIALISGRSLAALDRIFAPLRLPAIGGHGAELRLHDGGDSEIRQVDPLDDSLRERLFNIGKVTPGILVEDKDYAIALHYRLAPEVERGLHKEVAAICAQSKAQDLHMLHGKSVVEVKSAHFNKGTAVRDLMQHAPFKGRRPIFIGDDVTDEDVFPVLPAFGGIGLPVGRAMDGVASAFASPRNVRDWLARLSANGKS